MDMFNTGSSLPPFGMGQSRRAIQRRMRREFLHRQQIAEIRLNPPKETPDPVVLEEAPNVPEPKKVQRKKRKPVVLKKLPAKKMKSKEKAAYVAEKKAGVKAKPKPVLVTRSSAPVKKKHVFTKSVSSKL